ncbi:MAG: hypothetical protein NC180_09030 [Muribaculaceae bacterium]|nr:hypothetical protein [Muribaculaceae bacterium]
MQTRKAGNEEQLINTILFIYILGVGLAGFGFVMIFLHGGIRECIFLFSCVAAVITRLLEKRLGGVRKVCVRLHSSGHGRDYNGGL